MAASLSAHENGEIELNYRKTYSWYQYFRQIWNFWDKFQTLNHKEEPSRRTCSVDEMNSEGTESKSSWNFSFQAKFSLSSRKFKADDVCDRERDKDDWWWRSCETEACWLLKEKFPLAWTLWNLLKVPRGSRRFHKSTYLRLDTNQSCYWHFHCCYHYCCSCNSHRDHTKRKILRLSFVSLQTAVVEEPAGTRQPSNKRPWEGQRLEFGCG